MADVSRCTPLAVVAQRGYVEGVRLLCQYGADTEDVFRLVSNMPGLWSLSHSFTFCQPRKPGLKRLNTPSENPAKIVNVLTEIYLVTKNSVLSSKNGVNHEEVYFFP